MGVSGDGAEVHALGHVQRQLEVLQGTAVVKSLSVRNAITQLELSVGVVKVKARFGAYVWMTKERPSNSR